MQLVKLRQARIELERKVQDQEEELDDQAGKIQQLEQVLAQLSIILLFCALIGFLIQCVSRIDCTCFQRVMLWMSLLEQQLGWPVVNCSCSNNK